jgi:DNA-binding response OmpR family regulator
MFLHRDMNNTQNSPGRGPAGSAFRPGPNPHRILVVDEDSDLCLLYAFVLTGPGFRVDLAQDGVAGWKALQAVRYSLLITEHELPSLTGIELVKTLRAARMALPVVMVAGRLPVRALGHDPSLQLAATLQKPFAVDALIETVKKILGSTGSPPELTQPLPNWLNSHQPMFYGHNHVAPPPSRQLTIKYPEAVLGWVKRISHRSNHP